MRPVRTLGVGLVLFLVCASGLPGEPRDHNTVRSLPIAQVDAIIRQPGHRLVAVMASWCHPCVEELPALNALARQYRPHGLRTLGLSVDYAGPRAMQPIVEKLKLDFPVYWVGEAALEHYAVTRIPVLIFVRDGRVVKRLEGQRNRAEIEREILAFLETP